jgi:hypothetical protein
MVNLKDPNYRLYLPVLLSAKAPTTTQADAGSEVLEKKPNITLADRKKSLTYPGPQLIVSDVSNPTNSIQTILQPALKDPPVLPPPITLPNMVQMPEVVSPSTMPKPTLLDVVKAPELQPPGTPIQPELKPVELPVKVAPPPIDLKKVVLPVGGPQSIPDVAPPQLAELKTETVSASQSTSAPKQPNTADSAVTKRVEPLLTLSPMPAPPDDVVKVPIGEARGRFTISPDANSTGADEVSGSKSDRVSSTVGMRTDPEAGKTAGNGLAPTGDGSRKDKELSSSNETATNSRGGKAPTAATSSGADDGKLKSVFPGITILNSGAGANPISATGAPAPLQTSYGVTIVSTESSGGGLPQFGVFSNEQVFTVFVDMRRTISDPAPSWTFEYAILKGTAAPSNIVTLPKRNQQGVVLPFPTVKEQLVLPPELARKYARSRIIAYAVINVEGKMEQVVVKESPDPLLNEPVLSALTKWSFRPAQVNGENVAVKALMGIPIVVTQ